MASTIPALPGSEPLGPLATAEELLAALPWGVLVLDAQAVIRRVNRQAAQWCGMPAGSLLDQPLAQAPLPPALGAALRQLREPGAAPLKVWLPAAQQWLNLRAAPAPAGQHWIFLENVTARHQAETARQRSGHPPDNRRVAVLFSNTSEQKQVEAALREAEARYRQQLEQQVIDRTQQLQESRDLLQSVLDTSLISMSVLYAERDEAGQVQDFRLGLVNKELERETGRTDLAGKLYGQEYPGIRQVGIFDLMLRALATDEPQTLEYFYDHEGFNRWYTCQFVKMGDGVVATNLDITERKMAEQERLKSLRLLEQAEAVAGLGSWDYDLTTRYMRWSQGMYHLFGLPVGSPIEPSHYLAAVVEDDRPRAEQLVRQLVAGRGFEETLRLRVHGQVKTVRMKAVILRDEASQPVRILGVDVDISELQRLEADNLRLRLTQQQALFEAVQAAQEAERKRMAESLHNGIGQILYATKLRLDLLRSPLLAAAPPQEAARQEADHLLGEAIRQARALSHELVPMMLEEFGLAAALQDIGQKMSTAQLHLRTHVVLDDEAASLTPTLQMALYRMAQELAQNIAKHAHGATEASLELETTPGWVLLRVEDNGPGFAAPPASVPGLGLRSIRDQVALLGGRVETGSMPAGGAYVRIRIPLPMPG
jgi:signal transduction histidine kinase